MGNCNTVLMEAWLNEDSGKSGWGVLTRRRLQSQAPWQLHLRDDHMHYSRTWLGSYGNLWLLLSYQMCHCPQRQWLGQKCFEPKLLK